MLQGEYDGCLSFLVLLDNSCCRGDIEGSSLVFVFALHLTELSLRSKKFLCEKEVHRVNRPLMPNRQGSLTADTNFQVTKNIIS